MKLNRNIHGEALARHLERSWSFVRVSQNGSHIKLRTQVPTGLTATIPAHRPLKVGTLYGIVSVIAHHKGVSVEDILEGPS